jgi:hypothetical protein
MLDYNKYLMRHGEGWILQVVEDTERYFRVRVSAGASLEDRWNALMNDDRAQPSYRLAA